MTKFNPDIHTPDNRAAQIVDIFHQCPGVFLIGSVGRAAALGSPLPSVDKSFGTIVRDLDVTHGAERGVDLGRTALSPFPLDVALDGLIKLEPGRSYAQVLFDNRRPDVSVELPSDVFEPYPVRLGSETITTFHPDTLRYLHLICGRPKDVFNAARFARELTKVDYPRLPEKSFSPLLELQDMVAADPDLHRQRRIEQLSALYAMVPPGIRRYTTPPLRKIKRRLLAAEREHLSSVSA